MKEFIGVLFCGGKGTRLGEITKYISKSFVPVYDKPVFKYGLEALEKAKNVREIVILSNKDNYYKLKKTKYNTIIQDDKQVTDMFTGWKFVKNKLNTNKNGVLIPSDNICNIDIDYLISKFINDDADFTFSIKKLNNIKFKFHYESTRIKLW